MGGFLWPECVLIVVYLINRLPSSVLSGASPYFLVYGKDPSLSHIRSFGCLCYSTVLNSHDKFGSKFEKCVLIGFSSVKKSYKLYGLESKSVFYSRDVRFYETVFSFKMKSSNILNKSSNGFDKSDNVFNISEPNFDESRVNNLNFFDIHGSESPNDEEGDPSNVEGSGMVPLDDCVNTVSEGGATTTTKIEDTITSEGTNQNVFNGEDQNVQMEEPPSVRRSSRNRSQPVRFNDFVVGSNVKYGLEKYVSYSNLSKVNMCLSTTLNKSCEPKSLYEAIQNPMWKEAMNSEMEALHRNNTYELCELSNGRFAIGCKWIWKLKFKSSSEVDRYKARLVAKGYN